MARRAALVLAWALGACGNHAPAAAPPPPHRDDAARAAPRDAPAADLPERALGLPDLAAFGWRKRAGQPAFRTARAAEARGDWPAVLAACKDALAADPGHLDAAYLEAVAYARTGQLAQVAAPLQLAASGDFGKWGFASLDQPALQPFLATPDGAAWRRREELDRARYTAALGHALIVRASGDLYAVDLGGPRWYRLTHTGGAVIATYRPVTSGHRLPALAYVARVRARGAKEVRYEVGTIDLATGRGAGPAVLATGDDAIHVAWSRQIAAPAGGFVVRAKDGLWILDATGHLAAAPPHADYAAYVLGGTWLDVVAGRTSLRHAERGFDASADWDDHGLASAMRIALSNRVVAAPSPGRIDGTTVTWAPGRAHVAFVAQLDEHPTAPPCGGAARQAQVPARDGTPGADTAAAYVADVATGRVQELARGKRGLSIEWVDADHLAIADDDGVAIVALGGGAHPLTGADALVVPRRQPACAPAPPPGDEPPLDEGSD